MLLNVESPDTFLLVLMILTAWRFTSMIVYEEGPFNVFVWLRRLMVGGHLSTLVTCFHCSAFWISAVFVAIVCLPALQWILIIPAVAAGTSLLELLIATTRLNQNKTDRDY